MRGRDTVAARRRLLAYIAEVRALLRMDNWDIVLHEEPCEDEDAHAETWQHPNHSVLNIRLHPDFFDLEPAGVRNTVVHELTHAQHRDVTAVFESLSESDYVPKVLGETQDGLFHVHMERFVSWVADRIEGTMPEWDPRREVPNTLPPGMYLHERPH